MIGMSAGTGRTVSDRTHLAQSIADILTTPLGSRCMRREYGSQLVDLIDWPLNNATKLQAFAATAMALMRWEPRIRISRVQFNGISLQGSVVLELEATLVDSNEQQNISIPLSMGASV